MCPSNITRYAAPDGFIVHQNYDKKYKYNHANSNNTTVLNHINRNSNCKGTLDSFDVIGRAKNDFFLRIKESLLIKKIKPTLLNPNSQSVPLKLFDR